MRDRIDAAVEARFAEQVAFLAALVRQPSDNPPGDCAAHAHLAAGLLDALGFDVERHPVPAELCAAHGLQSVTNLVVRRHFGAGPVVALNAHGDVVPPGAGWTTDPYGAEIIDGRMHGRGVAVSKSDFATYAFAVLALEDAARPRRGTIELHLTYDEETGGELGPAWLLAQGISRPTHAIGAGFAHDVVIAHNGCLHLEVTVFGRSAHAARPETGHDALEAATAVLQALYAHRADLAQVRSDTPGIISPTLVVGLIMGGINTNVVPDQVSFRLDRRIVPEEDPAAVETGLEALIAAAIAGRPGIRATVRRILLATPLRPVAGALDMAEVVARHATLALGHDVRPVGTPLYTDARHYAAAGVPTVLYGAGPRDMLEANAHRADERLALSDLRAATTVIAASLAEILAA